MMFRPSHIVTADKYTPIIKSRRDAPIHLKVDDIELFHKNSDQLHETVKKMPNGFIFSTRAQYGDSPETHLHRVWCHVWQRGPDPTKGYVKGIGRSILPLFEYAQRVYPDRLGPNVRRGPNGLKSGLHLCTCSTEALHDALAGQGDSTPKVAESFVAPVHRYRDIDQMWPKQMPSLTAAEAKTAAKRLYHEFVEKRKPGYKLGGVEIGYDTTVGLKDAKNARPPWQWEDLIVVNPQNDWRDLVHRLSHNFHARVHSAPAEHDPRHRQLEADMVAWMISHGWLDGKLRPAGGSP
jgi:hypothetical protein